VTKAIVTRFKGNPILTKDDVPYPVATVHNAGMVKHDGRYLMLFRAHRRNGRSILGLAEIDDGFRFRVRPEPFMVPATEEVFATYEEYGVEDPRICATEDQYLITYSAYSRHGVRIGLAQTEDFESVERIALITQADYRNVVLFPRKFDGRYVVFACGAIPEEDGTVKIYWGGADSVMCVGTAEISDLVDLCLNKTRSPV
jgi:predicted GH43/DUF377 family glycosyl hydrolase